MKDKDMIKKAIEKNIQNKEITKKNVFDSINKNSSLKHKKPMSFKNKYAFSIMSLFLLFFIMVNTSESFAYNISNIPILGSIAKVVTLSEYSKNSDTEFIQVKVPKVVIEGNDNLARKINKEISNKIDILVNRAEQYASEYKKNYVGGENKESDYIPMTYIFDYKVYSSSNNILSFVIIETEINNTTQKYLDEMNVPEKAEYITYHIYNINLNTGKDIKLSDLLGEDYKSIIDKEIDRQVRERAQKDSNLLYYYEEFYASKGTKGIDENEQFYINNLGNPVIVFDKYTIAPEYAGIQEFEIFAKYKP